VPLATNCPIPSYEIIKPPPTDPTSPAPLLLSEPATIVFAATDKWSGEACYLKHAFGREFELDMPSPTIVSVNSPWLVNGDNFGDVCSYGRSCVARTKGKVVVLLPPGTDRATAPLAVVRVEASASCPPKQ
jgi:hypothetical protein